MKTKYLTLLAVSFFLGIFTFHFFIDDLKKVVLFYFFILIIFFIFDKNKRLVKNFFFTMFFLFIFSLGFFWAKRDELKKNPLENFFDEKFFCEGVIVSDPDIRHNHQKLTIKLDKIGEKKVDAKILALDFFKRDFEYGDRVFFVAKIEKPPNDENFSYERYLKIRGISAIVPFANIMVKSKHNKNPLIYNIFKLKNSFLKNINYLILEPESSISAGILIGAKKGLTKELENDFRKSGLTHILVVSGYNISILLFVVSSLLSSFSRRIKFFSALLIVSSFVILTGADPSVLRAGLMGIIGFFAISTGRKNSAFRGLLFTALGMSMFAPMYITHDLGFQLSFMATLGLITLSPILEKIKFPNILGLKESLVSCISAQIFVFPILILSFKGVSTISLFANIIVAPLLVPAMIFSAIAGFIGFFSLKLAIFPAIFGQIFLKLIILIAKFFANFYFSFAKIKDFTVTKLIIYYFILFLFIFFLKKQNIENSDKRKCD